MAVVDPPTIAPAPPTPDRANRATFATLAQAFTIWMSAAGPQIVAVATNVRDNALEALGFTNSAQAAAQAAASARDAAVAASNAPLWASGNYVTGAVTRAPSNLLAYVRKAPGGASPTDPASDPANWQALGSGSLKTTAVAGAAVTAVDGQRLDLQNAAATTITAPVGPVPDARIAYVQSNNRTDNLFNPNGAKIGGATVASVILPPGPGEIVYISAGRGWEFVSGASSSVPPFLLLQAGLR